MHAPVASSGVVYARHGPQGRRSCAEAWWRTPRVALCRRAGCVGQPQRRVVVGAGGCRYARILSTVKPPLGRWQITWPWRLVCPLPIRVSMSGLVLEGYRGVEVGGWRAQGASDPEEWVGALEGV